jgi:Probable lipoprotein LpqN
MAADPPNIITLVSRLAGTGTDRALAYAPGELRNMTDFEGDAGTTIKVSGFNAWQLGGTFTREDGVKRAIVQTTVEIPAPDGVFIMQSNADGTPEQLGLLRDTMRIVDEQTTITPP